MRSASLSASVSVSVTLCLGPCVHASARLCVRNKQQKRKHASQQSNKKQRGLDWKRAQARPGQARPGQGACTQAQHDHHYSVPKTVFYTQYYTHHSSCNILCIHSYCYYILRTNTDTSSTHLLIPIYSCFCYYHQHHRLLATNTATSHYNVLIVINNSSPSTP